MRNDSHKHLLLIHQAFVSPHEAGGTRHFELAQYFRKKGIDLTIVASDLSYLTGGKVSRRQGLVTHESVAKFNVYRARTYPALHRSFIWRVISFFSFMVTSLAAALRAGAVDGVLGTSPPIFQALSAWSIARIRGVPFILEVRDLWPEFAVDMGVLTNPLLIRLSRGLESFLYAQASHIVVNSPAYRDYLKAKGIKVAKISLIPNGVDCSMFNGNSGGHLRKKLGLTENFVITYAGALGPANDIPILLKAANLLRKKEDIHFLIVGDGKDREKLITMAKNLNLSNITFLGARPKSEIPRILAASDACLAILQNIPMFRTTYPNKVFDYMAAGRPTLLAIDGVIREVVEAASGGVFVPPGDYQALASAVVNLAADPFEAKQMGAAARRYVARHFNRNQQAEQFAQLLHKSI